MLELILAGIMIVTMIKIADADDQSPFIWGGAAIVLCVLCLMFVPIAYARVLLAAILTFAAMTVYKMVKK